VTLELVVQAAVSGLVIGAVYALIAAGLTLIFGVMDILNIAHGAMVMVGMYVTYWLFALFGIDPYISLPLAMVALFVLGITVYYALLGPLIAGSGTKLLLMTLALMLVLENGAIFLWGADVRAVNVPYRSVSVAVGPAFLTLPRVLAFGCALLITAGLYLFLTRSIAGKALRACADDRTGASVVGINPTRMYAIAFGVGAACAGAAGAIVVPFFYVSPHVGFGFLMPAFVIVVLGGLGNFWGALIGGLIVGLVEALGALVLPASAKQILSLGIFVLILLFRPQGIFGEQRS
jgi:branched-chain amino acid transport system permease protein